MNQSKVVSDFELSETDWKEKLEQKWIDSVGVERIYLKIDEVARLIVQARESEDTRMEEKTIKKTELKPTVKGKKK